MLKLVAVILILAAASVPAAFAGDPPEIYVLEYHHPYFAMSDEVVMTPEWFEEQMKWLWENGYQGVSAEELVGYITRGEALPDKSVVLTFDLGSDFQDSYGQIVVPALVKYQLKAIFLVVPGFVADECGREGFEFCWEQLGAWQKTGYISFGSHSVTHRDLGQLSPGQVTWELQESKARIEEHLGVNITVFAYPFEIPPVGFETLLAEAGYELALGGINGVEGLEPRDSRRWNLPRQAPYSNELLYPRLCCRAYGLTFAEMMSN